MHNQNALPDWLLRQWLPDFHPYGGTGHPSGSRHGVSFNFWHLNFMLKPLLTLALIVTCVGQITAAAEKKPGLQTIAELQAEIEKILRETGVP